MTTSYSVHIALHVTCSVGGAKVGGTKVGGAQALLLSLKNKRPKLSTLVRE